MLPCTLSACERDSPVQGSKTGAERLWQMVLGSVFSRGCSQSHIWWYGCIGSVRVGKGGCHAGDQKAWNCLFFQTTALGSHSSPNPAAFLYSPGRLPGEILSPHITSPLSYIGVGRENEQIMYYRYPNYEAPMPSLSAGHRILVLDGITTLLCREQMQLYTSAMVENMVTLGQSLIKSILKHLRLEH